jgi:glucosamine--fructose-6-phosphate aminotransferase (isomerizing)
MTNSPFERDITGQAGALRTLHSTPLPTELSSVDLARYGRIIITGMGSSHFAALRGWRRLVARGLPAWWVDTSQLLDSPELVDDDTLLIATSQSGASGEIVALLEQVTARTVIGITNRSESPLASRADIPVLLHSGPEASVSTKSYLNSLAVHEAVIDCLLKAAPLDKNDPATAVEQTLVTPALQQAATVLAEPGLPRLAYIGFADHGATALYAGLITKEAAKVPAEGYLGGQFRHGPLELAGPGLVAVLFGGSATTHPSLHRLAVDLSRTGSTVLTVGGLEVPWAHPVATPGTGALAELMTGAVVAQLLTVEIARARGITPGEFTYADKVTRAL